MSAGRAETWKSRWCQFDLAVVACILALAILLGILNNLRVAEERKVKWFGAPDVPDEAEKTEGRLP